MALTFLAGTDEQAAELKVQVERKSYVLELARKEEFLAAEGSVEQRKATAEVTPHVTSCGQEYLDAMLEYEKVRAKRTTEALIVEVYRTVSANRRSGNI